MFVGSTPTRVTGLQGREPDTGSPERIANACRRVAVRVRFPSLPLVPWW